MNASISDMPDPDAILPEGDTTAPALSSSTRLLVIAPHPDDETIATGLLIQQVLAAGGEVRALSLTPGDNNPWPQRWLEKRARIGVADRVRWGGRRHEELLRATAQLGLDPGRLRTLAWADQGLTERLRVARQESVATLREQLDEFAPNLVAIPALQDGHPDHSAAHVLARLAMMDRTPMPCCVAYGIHSMDSTGQESRVYWPSTDCMRVHKRAALECHQTQLALSGGRMRRFAARPECYALVSDDPTLRPSNELPWAPPPWLASRLRLTVVTSSGTHCWRWAEAPLRRDDNGRWRLVLPSDISTGHCFVRLESTLPSLWIFDHWGWCELSA